MSWKTPSIEALSATHFVYHGSAFDADGTEADVMIVDPPYSEHVHASAVSQAPKKGVRERDLGFDHLSPELRDHLGRIASKVRRWSVIYSDVEGLHDWRIACTSAGAEYIRPIPWIRWSMPQLSGDRPPTGCEMTSCFWGSTSGKKSWNGPGNLTHLDHKCLRGAGKHKAEKPLDQLLDLVSWFSDAGEIVADYNAGAGTTGLACRILSRRFVGVELSAEWAEKANARIQACTVQRDASGAPVKVSGLSDRDQERFERWLESSARLVQDRERIATNTARVRAKADAVKAESSEGTIVAEINTFYTPEGRPLEEVLTPSARRPREGT